MTDHEGDPDPWPASRSPALLTWADAEVDVRVMRPVDEVTLLCTVASDDADLRVPEVDTEVEVQWANESGLWSRPAAVAQQRFRLLTLQATGGVRREQRRRFYRAPVHMEVELVQGRTVIRGRTNDMSESGARVTVEGNTLRPKARITTRVNLETGQVDIPTVVVRSKDHDGDDEIGIQFGAVTPSEADAIRRQVISAQIDERRKDKR